MEGGGHGAELWVELGAGLQRGEQTSVQEPNKELGEKPGHVCVLMCLCLLAYLCVWILLTYGDAVIRCPYATL